MALQLHERIRQRRRELGWSMDRLAQRAGYAKGTIRRLERGYLTHLTTVQDVCKALGLSLELGARAGA